MRQRQILRHKDWDFRNKIARRCSGWQGIMLNIGGRATLAQSSIFSFLRNGAAIILKHRNIQYKTVHNTRWWNTTPSFTHFIVATLLG
jgi:hypothetical protein